MSVSRVFDVLKVLRFPNLLVVATTQALVFYQVLLPAFAAYDITPVLSWWKLLELLIVTVLITASGYLINDLQDIRTDAINRPGTNPVVRLGERTVTWFYISCILGGFLVSLLLAFQLNERSLLWIFPLAVGILSVYSTGLKRIPVMGNLMVALYCAGVPGVILLAERAGVRRLISADLTAGYDALRVCVLFMVFAFFATLLRELIKDLEDIRGDRAVGRRTIPVMWGASASRYFGVGLGLIVVVAILLPVLLGWPAFIKPPLLACIAVLLLGLAIIIVQLLRARAVRDYKRLSFQLKLFLLGGLGLLIFF